MKDFLLPIFKELIRSIQKSNYTFQTFLQFIETPKEKAVMLRHDVDKMPNNSLTTAWIESKLGIRGTYYFRTTPLSWDEKVIKDISSMGHEIGYHYENMDTCNGNIDKAFEDFKKNLEKFRKVADVKTICMHGSPRSKHDNKDLWAKYNYKNLGIIGEPYFDIDFSKVFYLTDTGRCWNGNKLSIRDNVDSSFKISFQHTKEIIDAANNGILPEQIMFTLHPQRWTNNLYFWTKELAMQNIKNQVKSLILAFKK